MGSLVLPLNKHWFYSCCVLCCRMMSELSAWFWQERLWFPEGLGWADLEDRDGRVYAKARDLWVALPIALLFLIIRQIFERSVPSSHCLIGSLFPSSFSVVINSEICFLLYLHIFSIPLIILTIPYYMWMSTPLEDSYCFALKVQCSCLLSLAHWFTSAFMVFVDAFSSSLPYC